MSFQPTFHNGIFRDCKWCRGKGCISCPVEADKAYKRDFPEGPKPILTIPNEDFDHFEISQSTGGPGISEAHGELGSLVASIFEAIKQRNQSPE